MAVQRIEGGRVFVGSMLKGLGEGVNCWVDTSGRSSDQPPQVCGTRGAERGDTEMEGCLALIKVRKTQYIWFSLHLDPRCIQLDW